MDDCSTWLDRLDFLTPGRFLEACEELLSFERQGLIQVVKATHPLESVRSVEPFPRDIMCWTVKCLATGKLFELSADTYHGRCEWRLVK